MPTLKLAAPSRHAARDILLAAAAAGVDLDVTTGADGVCLTAASGEAIAEHNTACRHLASLAPDGGAALLGRTAEEQALVSEGVGWWGRGAPSVGVGAAKQKHAAAVDRPHTPLRSFPTPLPLSLLHNRSPTGWPSGTRP